MIGSAAFLAGAEPPTAAAATGTPSLTQAAGEGAAASRVGVFALGSVLMGDDGVGSNLLARLESRWELPAEVSLIDLGTPGPDLSDWIAGHRAVLVVDAIRQSGVAAGTVRELSRAELARLPAGPRMSPHDPGIGEALLKAELTGEAPAEMTLVGIVPAVVELGTELSPPVAAALDEAERLILAILARWGVTAQRRDSPLPVRAFWANPAAV